MSCAKVPSSQSATYPTALDIRLVVCALAFFSFDCELTHALHNMVFKTESRLGGWLQRNFLPFLPCGTSLPYICVIKKQSQQWTLRVGVRQMSRLHLQSVSPAEICFPSLILNTLTWKMGTLLLFLGVGKKIEWNDACKPPTLVPCKSIPMALGNIWHVKRNENGLSRYCSLFRLLKEC